MYLLTGKTYLEKIRLIFGEKVQKIGFCMFYLSYYEWRWTMIFGISNSNSVKYGNISPLLYLLFSTTNEGTQVLTVNNNLVRNIIQIDPCYTVNVQQSQGHCHTPIKSISTQIKISIAF